jgi:hypothetical protein
MSQKPLSYETLRSQVNSLAVPTPAMSSGESKTASYADYAKPPYVFGVVPVVIAIALYFAQPFFIMEQDPKYQEGEGPKILSYKKLMIFDIVISCMIIGAYYYYYGKDTAKAV